MTERITLDEALKEMAKKGGGRTNNDTPRLPKMNKDGTPKAKRTHPEQDEQERLFRWIRAFESDYPELKRVRGSLNGVPLHPVVAKTAHKMGMRKGEWDVFIDLPTEVETLCGTYLSIAGMYIEMKWGKNTLTTEQEAFRADRQRWHEFRVCYSAKSAAECLVYYIYDLSVPNVLLRSLTNPLYFVPEELK